MNLTEEQIKQVAELAKPLAQWMVYNCHPHVTALVESTSVELVEGIARTKLETIIIG